MDGNLTSLVKQLESTVENNSSLRAFVVVLTDDADATAQSLKDLAKSSKIDNVPLTLSEGASGPPEYKIAADADVTVMVWKGARVQSNHALKKGDLNEKSIAAVIADAEKAVK